MDQPGTVNKIKSKNFLIVTEKQKSLNFLYFMDQIGSVNKKKNPNFFFNCHKTKISNFLLLHSLTCTTQ